MNKKILVVENNADLIDFLKEYFKEHSDFDLYTEASGLAAIKIIRTKKPDLLIVDLGLDDIKGDVVCAEAKKLYRDLPVIILTGDKSESSIVNTLNTVADDYITKPFNPEELIARINAKLRLFDKIRTELVLECKDLKIDLESTTVTRGGKEIQLTAREFELLKYLLVNKNRIVSRDKILFAVWGYTYEVDTRVVDVHIGKLRKKIDSGSKEKIIESVRGFGYRAND